MNTHDTPATRPNTPTLHRWLIVMLAIASIGTTVLVVLNIFARQNAPQPLRAGVVTPASSPHPPVLTTLPPFTLTDQTGADFGSQNLRGKAWIADFIFTRCAGPCPMLTSRMAQIQALFDDHPQRDDFRLVSFSVDPENDTPPALREYARLAHADAQLWHFLTGPHDTLWHLVRDGFKLPVGPDPDNTAMPIFHSQKFVLIDQLGRVRGFYDALSEHDRDQLMGDLDRLLAQNQHPRTASNSATPAQPQAQHPHPSSPAAASLSGSP